MRDPNRIPRVLAKLQQVWEKYPDLRLGQLVVNLSPASPDAAVWFVEDDQLEERIDLVLSQGTWKHPQRT